MLADFQSTTELPNNKQTMHPQIVTLHGKKLVPNASQQQQNVYFNASPHVSWSDNYHDLPDNGPHRSHIQKNGVMLQWCQPSLPNDISLAFAGCISVTDGQTVLPKQARPPRIKSMPPKWKAAQRDSTSYQSLLTYATTQTNPTKHTLRWYCNAVMAYCD